LALCDNGTVYSWGSNSRGQLGHGDFLARETPTKILQIKDPIVQIRCGDYFSMALSTSGTLWCWGSSEYGECGEEESLTIPTIMETVMLQAKSISIIAAGSNHAAALSYSGDVYSWGCGYDGQLGHDVGSGEEKNLLPRIVETNLKFSDVYCGSNNTFFITEHAPYVDIQPSSMQSDMMLLMQGRVPFTTTLVYGPIEIDAHLSVVIARSRTLSKLSRTSRINLEEVLGNCFKDVKWDTIQSSLRKTVEIMYTGTSTYDTELDPFVVRWLNLLQINASTLALDMKRIINDYDTHDILIRMNDEIVLYAHKDILSARCDVFRAMLRSQLRESREGVIELTDEDGTITDYEKVIHYLYTDEESFTSDERASVFNILKISDLFGLERLKTICEKFIADNLSQNVNRNNWTNLCDFSKSHNATQLYEYCKYRKEEEKQEKEKIHLELDTSNNSDISLLSSTTNIEINTRPRAQSASRSRIRREQIRIVSNTVVDTIKKHSAKLSSLKRRQSIQVISTTLLRFFKKLILFLLFVIFYIPFSLCVLCYGLFLRIVDKWLFD
jgi:hypothetical protein